MPQLSWVLRAAIATFALSSSTTVLADEERDLWAYPHGVIVNNTIWVKDLDTLPKLRKELEAFSASVIDFLETCGSALRDQKGDEIKDRRLRFQLHFNLSVYGEATQGKTQRSGGDLPLPACLNELPRKAHDYNFSPDRGRKPLSVTIASDMLFLHDDAAKGRGFKFLQGERRWEAVKRPTWFACDVDKDCVVSTEMCEVRAINRQYADAYRTAIRQRFKPACRPEDTNELDTGPTACLGRTCVILKSQTSEQKP